MAKDQGAGRLDPCLGCGCCIASGNRVLQTGEADGSDGHDDAQDGHAGLSGSAPTDASDGTFSRVLFHSAHEVGDQVVVVDFWPSAAAFQGFAEGPMAEGMKAAGIAPPDDVEITPVLNADSR